MASTMNKRSKVPSHWTIQQRLDFYTHSRPDDPNACWEWRGAKSPLGYGRMFVTGQRERQSHRLSWIAANGPIPAGMNVCHKCDNPACIRPSHLFLGTHADNAADRETKGRGNQPTGERVAGAKLNATKVKEIRALFGRESNLSIAKRYGVSEATIWWIRKGDHWKSLG
jgi:hypothetical protein